MLSAHSLNACGAQKIASALRSGRRRSSVERETIRDARRGLVMVLRAAAKFRVFLKRVRDRHAAGGAPPPSPASAQGAQRRGRRRTVVKGRAGEEGNVGAAGDAAAASPPRRVSVARPQSAAGHAAGHVAGHVVPPRGYSARVPGTVLRPPRRVLRAGGGWEAPTGRRDEYAALALSRRGAAGGGVKAPGVGPLVAIARSRGGGAGPVNAFSWAPL
jgi:hypothetical protein